MGVARIAYSLVVRAPAERVFDFVADWANAARFVPNLTRLRPTGEVRQGLGTRLRGAVGLLGVELESESEVVEFQPPHRIATRSVSGLAHRGLWLFQRVPDGTRVTAAVEYRLPPLPAIAIAGPLVRLQFELGVKRALRNVQRLLEGGEGDGHSQQ